MSRILFRSARFFLLASATLAVPATSASGWCGCVIDGHTRYMWARTWYGPNALDTPLRDYYVPRTPVNIDCADYSGGGCQSGVTEAAPNQYGARPYPATAAAGFEPAQFERLGKIPN
ncbi:MAG TPA: hypothetical protein VHU84_00710 [Lacipirellulaceae bacterium]|nr:hypothetical protein [Lacipirellulaceae bacterium]